MWFLSDITETAAVITRMAQSSLFNSENFTTTSRMNRTPKKQKVFQGEATEIFRGKTQEGAL